MKLSEWGVRVIAILVAWCAILAACAVAGRFLGFRLWPAVVAWLWIGLAMMLRDAGDAPMPAATDVDVIGAFHMLWWAALWPGRLVKKLKGKK